MLTAGVRWGEEAGAT